MKVDLRSPYTAGAFLVGALALFLTYGRCAYLKDQVVARDSRITAMQLAEQGYKDTIAASPKEVIKLVDRVVTKEVIKYVKEGKVTPIASVAGKATSNPVVIPVRPNPDSVTNVTEVKAETAPVTFEVDAQLLILGLKDGAPLWRGDIKGAAFMTQPEWRTDLTFAPENTLVTVKFSDEVTKAIQAYQPSFFKRHFKVQCPGVAIVYDVIDKDVAVGPSCSFGYVW